MAIDFEETVRQAAQPSSERDETWRNPEPLSLVHFKSRSYPLNALPAIIRKHVEAIQNYGQQPLAIVASATLAATSLACQGLANVSRDGNLIGPCSLNFLIVAGSGERKTSVDRRCRRSVERWQRAERDRQRPEIEAATAKLAAWQDGLLAAIRKAAGGRTHRTKLTADSCSRSWRGLAGEQPHVPPVVSLFAEDSTAEALALDLGMGWPSSSLWSDEGRLGHRRACNE